MNEYGFNNYEDKRQDNVDNYYSSVNHVDNRNNNRKNKDKKEKFSVKATKFAALGLVFGLTAGAGFQAVNVASNAVAGNTSSTEAASESTTESSTEKVATTTQKASTTTTSTSSSDGSTMTVSEVAQALLPATVAINSTGTTTVSTMWGNAQQEYSSSGTGIIVGQNDTELLIATNNHVVEDSETISVDFIDDSSASALIKGTDADNDLAVIAVQLEDISSETMTEISIAELGDSDALTVGEEVVAIGNALGYGQSVTTGVISATNREVTTEASSNDYLIQTDAAINPGNSGGALVNMQGQVIGINSAKASSEGVEGMGYAIPINVASPILDELMNRETRTTVDEEDKSALGIMGQDIDSTMSESYNIPEGIYIVGFSDGSAAQDAGMQEKDILVSFDGTDVTTIEKLQKLLTTYAAGETVDVTVMRLENGEYVEKELTITLGHAQATTTETEASEDPYAGQEGNYGDSYNGFSFFGR